MTASEFRHRGIEVVVDTTRPAEFDIAGFHLSNEFVETIARQLKSVTFSKSDRCHGISRIRTISDYDVIFVVGREVGKVVITIAGVLPADDQSMTEELMKRVDAIAILRSATGI